MPESNKTPLINYPDLEFSIEKIDGCKNNPKISTITKVGEYI